VVGENMCRALMCDETLVVACDLGRCGRSGRRCRRRVVVRQSGLLWRQGRAQAGMEDAGSADVQGRSACRSSRGCCAHESGTAAGADRAGRGWRRAGGAGVGRRQGFTTSAHAPGWPRRGRPLTGGTPADHLGLVPDAGEQAAWARRPACGDRVSDARKV